MGSHDDRRAYRQNSEPTSDSDLMGGDSQRAAEAATAAAASAAESAAEIAAIAREQMRSENRPGSDSHVSAVLLALADLKADQRVIRSGLEVLRDRQEQVLVRMAKGEGRFNLLEQSTEHLREQVEGVRSDSQNMKVQLDAVVASGKEVQVRLERLSAGGYSSDAHRAVRAQRSNGEARAGWISESTVPKIIGAVFAGAALLAGAFFGTRAAVVSPNSPAAQHPSAPASAPP